ncbi:hypothetical protein HR11_06910 [Porphyromonas macacae]|uniref:Transmembrane protein n=1 Tax=Porphyromonas macacae TaxID=28115 RepID=A0A0A2GHH8_9PORP|nr:hypothetical protein [Porphyromonas macacae]KGN75006.1 hypothetical protein HQ47_03605 [Porphyromonas macacae]KGN99924.1 hypothetical protein HR11_06910 [Porphyromonas macacae]SUB89193.1 Uncharacterised protein [Porphyromonas macacae]
MTKKNKTQLPMEEQLQDPMLSRLFSKLPLLENGTLFTERIMESIREADIRRKKRSKTVAFILLGLTSLFGLALVGISIYYAFIMNKPADESLFKISLPDSGLFYIVPFVFFFYLTLDLYLTHRIKKKNKS